MIRIYVTVGAYFDGRCFSFEAPQRIKVRDLDKLTIQRAVAKKIREPWGEDSAEYHCLIPSACGVRKLVVHQFDLINAKLKYKMREVADQHIELTEKYSKDRAFREYTNPRLFGGYYRKWAAIRDACRQAINPDYRW